MVTPTRSSIIHSYAKWTALSALRSGSVVKSKAELYPLIADIKPKLDTLFDDSLGPIDPSSFATWHRETVEQLMTGSRLCVGWAAKVINVYLKTSVYVGGLGRAGLDAVIHPPIDGGLWAGLEAKFKLGSDVCSKTHTHTRITDITTYAAYETIIEGCRLAAKQEKCLLIEVDQWWQGADWPAHPAVESEE